MLRMAKSKTHGCDAHSSRCTQLLIGTTSAVEYNRVTVYFIKKDGGWRRAGKDWGEELRVLVQVKRAHDGVGRITDGTVSITDVR